MKHIRGPKTEPPPFKWINNTRLLHFDGWTALHWTAKLLHRVNRAAKNNVGRQNQLDFMRDAADAATRRSLFTRLQQVSPETERLMRQHGLIRDFDFDPLPAIRARFPAGDFSFRVADFDAALESADPEFFRLHGLSAGPVRTSR
jgi:hypothetical protein